MVSSRVSSMIAGVLVANSAPHLASAAAGRQHLTPLAGRQSSAAVNAVWGAANLLAGLLLLRRLRRTAPTRQWGEDLLAFETGYLAFAAWMAGSERWTRINSATPAGRPRR
jgi:hypothetical protein